MTRPFTDLSLIVRGLAALGVVWWHTIGYRADIPGFLAVPGRVSVWLFFIISGYVIGHGLFRRYEMTSQGLMAFYRNRLLRIYPLFLLISVVALVTATAQGLPVAVGIDQFLPIQWRQNYVLCGVFWTLGIELQFYLVAPLLALLLRHRATGVAIYVLLLAYPYVANNVWGESFDNRTTLGNLSHFVAGMLVASVAVSVPRKRVVGLIAGAILCIGLASHLFRAGEAFWTAAAGPVLTDAAGALLLIASTSLGERRWPNLAVWAGVLSYGIYAWHGYLLVYFPWFTDHLIATGATSAALAYATFRLVERPALTLKSPAPGLAGISA